MEKGQRRWGETQWRRAEGLARGLDTAPCEVAIVGGGLTGASTACHLAKRGIRSTIFEAARIGDGASGRTGGLVLEGTAAGVLEEVGTCIAELEALVAEERIDCDLSLPGCWEIEHRAGAIDKTLPWNDGGRPVSIARTVKGGVVQPAALVGAIARAAVLRGAVILESRPVQRIAVKPQLMIESDGEGTVDCLCTTRLRPRELHSVRVVHSLASLFVVGRGPVKYNFQRMFPVMAAKDDGCGDTKPRGAFDYLQYS
jgi:hypothetical protein